MKARILTLDLETAPAEVYVWGLRDQNVGIDQIKHDQYVLMWAAKWLGESEVMHDALINHPSAFRDNKRDDRQIALSLRKVMDEADIIVTQNGEGFDLKWTNQLMLKHGIEKPKKAYSVDLLRESRRNYYSISHRLDFRGRQLAIGSKTPHEGFRLWLSCMSGNKAAWGRMIEYCKNDVKLTESYYLKLRPRMNNHPNVNMFHEPKLYEGRFKCGSCGSGRLKRKGWRYLIAGRKQKYKCQDCGYLMVMSGPADITTKVLMRGAG